MPELPDITIYLEALEKRILHQKLLRLQINSLFLLRSATPPIDAVAGKKVIELRRLGKRICFGFEEELWLVLHLMIAGRLHWQEVGGSTTVRGGGAVARPLGRAQFSAKSGKNQLAVFHFDNGELSLTEAGTKRRASLHVIKGEAALQALDRGGIELFPNQKPGRAERQPSGAKPQKFIDFSTFKRVLKSENHTLKRALTDPRLFSGIGNAYSDEILWQAQLSPLKLTQKMTDEEIERPHRSTRAALLLWIERVREENGDAFSGKVTAVCKRIAVDGGHPATC